MIILKQVEQLQEKIIDLQKQINAIPRPPEYVECEICGCLLKKDTAFKGNPEVRQKLTPTYNLYYPPYLEDYIFYPYFCKTHIPKEKK